jgi:hypothetical protein
MAFSGCCIFEIRAIQVMSSTGVSPNEAEIPIPNLPDIQLGPYLAD